MTATTQAAPSASRLPTGIGRLWRRELPHYPSLPVRLVSLSIVVLTTVLFYYQYYAISGVSVGVMSTTGMSFLFFVNINVVSALVSALTSLAGGVSDRYGRANIVTVGVLLCGLVCLLGFPHAHSAWSVAVLYAVLGAIEGTVLVATPALIRDFSPQVGRATAMGFWTIGPVAGSLVVSVVVSNTSDHLHAWQDQYVIAGFAGLGVFLLALFFLRDLSPRLRDQVMVSERDRALVEARAQGLDVERALERPFRQVLRPDIVLSAVAISVFLFIYYVAVGFFPVYFQTLFGFSESKANSLGNWMWGVETAALIFVGLLSDVLRVRKPFMLVGAVGAIITTILLINQTTDAHTGYYTFVAILVPLALSLGLVFAPWMASFTETVERRNPALTGTGLSLWGLTVRGVVTVSTFILPFVVTTATTLVQDGPTVQAVAGGQDPRLTPAQNAVVKQVAADPTIVDKTQRLAGKWAKEIDTADAIDPKTLATLTADQSKTGAVNAALKDIQTKRNVPPAEAINRLVALSKVPPADLDYLNKYGTALKNRSVQDVLRYLEVKGPKVQQAVNDSPGEWQTYFWIAVAGEALFIPAIFLMAGAWSPATARRREREHEAAVQAELAKLTAAGDGPAPVPAQPSAADAERPVPTGHETREGDATP